MKTQQEIEFKILVHESEINKILGLDRKEWIDGHVELIEKYILGRKALMWVLSPDDFITPDDFEKKALFECTCHESTKIF